MDDCEMTGFPITGHGFLFRHASRRDETTWKCSRAVLDFPDGRTGIAGQVLFAGIQIGTCLMETHNIILRNTID